MDKIAQYKNEVARAQRAHVASKFMQEYFDEASADLYATFVNLDPQDKDKMQELVLLHKNLVVPQMWLTNIMETGKLAQVELDKDN